jgi:hypothetical protein
MLKTLLWLLIIANAAMLAAHQGLFGAAPTTQREPARMREQINVDKIRLLEPGVVPASATPAAPALPAAPAAPTSTPATPPQPTSAVPAGSVRPASAGADALATAERLACLEVGTFTAEEARRFEAALDRSLVNDRLSRVAVQETISHMVYIPSQGDREAAERKTAELRRLGVIDYFVIQDNSDLRWGISLGVFRSEEAARAHLTQLAQKGVRTARIGNRGIRASMVAFRLRDVDGARRVLFEKAAAEFAGRDLRECATRS